MLVSLSIHNFAIIEDLDVSFFNNMSILTGETGAGKSILIDALSLLIGERSDFDKIREGANKAIIEGEFIIANTDIIKELKEKYGDDYFDDNHLLITRILDSSGRSFLRLNGLSISLTKIKDIMNRVIDIHSQNENLALLDDKMHLSLLDDFIGPNDIYKDFQCLYNEYLKEKEHLNELEKKRLNNDDMEILQNNITELKSANIVVGEINELEEEKHNLMILQKETQHLATFQSLSDGDQGFLTKLYLAKKELERSESNIIQEYYEQINDMYYSLQDISNDIARDLNNVEDSLVRLQDIDERLFYLKRLMKKYGEDEEGLLNYLKLAQEQVDTNQQFQRRYQEQESIVFKKEKELQTKAQELHELRAIKGQELEQLIEKEMHDLALENARFKVEIVTQESLNGQGLDQITFLISTNKGSRLLPLRQVASGGETSRIMLALKTVFSRFSALETIIFDEVDTGVSGRVAMHVARKMKEISKYVQVIAISHLPQVAAIADYHYYVEKIVDHEVTKSSIRLLNEKEIIPEIAKLLSGDIVSDVSLKAASSLREEALKEN